MASQFFGSNFAATNGITGYCPWYLIKYNNIQHLRIMDKTTLKLMANSAKTVLAESLRQYVREHGADCTEDDADKFSFHLSVYGVERVTKVYDFSKHGGCFFFEPAGINLGLDLDEDTWYDSIYEGVTHTTYRCLYIVEDAEGTETLRYNMLTNGGVNLDEDQADDVDGEVSGLPLSDLERIISSIRISG